MTKSFYFAPRNVEGKEDTDIEDEHAKILSHVDNGDNSNDDDAIRAEYGLDDYDDEGKNSGEVTSK